MLWAFVALLSWGVGDFLIQRSARRFGDGVALFYITAFAAVFLLPFVWGDLASVFVDRAALWLLIVTSLIVLGAALSDFEALRVGKISVVEPVYALEVPVTTALATFIFREPLTWTQLALMFALMVGIFLVSASRLGGLKRIRWERGIFLAFVATMGMGTVNFLFGVGARETSPLLINWFTSTYVALAMLIYLIATRRTKEITHHWKKNRGLIWSVSIIDNLAWVAFAFATLTIPIAIATGISESYIALAAVLGVVFNRERLRKHQVLGLVLALAAAIMLAVVTEG